MNLYIPLNDLNIFMQNLKDFTKYDDYFLDGERLGKQRIVFTKIEKENQFFEDIFPFLPSNSMLVFSEIMNNNKDFLLCVGDVDINNINYLIDANVIPSIYTKTEDRVRLNFWVSCSDLNKIYNDGVVSNFNTIKGKINERPFFVLETSNVNSLLNNIQQDTNKYIIKNNKIFVNLSLTFFCENYEILSPLLEKVQIIDKDEF